MKISHDKRKKLMSIFILIVFAGSTLAFAFLSVFSDGNTAQDPIEETKLTIFKFDRPLTAAEETPYQKQDIVILKFYYSNDCSNCSDIDLEVEQLWTDSNNRILLEKINTDEYSVNKNTPSIELKGSRSKILTSFDNLENEVCNLYFDAPSNCD
jgi:hypothetical protein